MLTSDDLQHHYGMLYDVAHTVLHRLGISRDQYVSVDELVNEVILYLPTNSPLSRSVVYCRMQECARRLRYGMSRWQYEHAPNDPERFSLDVQDDKRLPTDIIVEPIEWDDDRDLQQIAGVVSTMICRRFSARQCYAFWRRIIDHADIDCISAETGYNRDSIRLLCRRITGYVREQNSVSRVKP